MPRIYRTPTDLALKRARRNASRKIARAASQGIHLESPIPLDTDPRGMRGSTKSAQIRALQQFTQKRLPRSAKPRTKESAFTHLQNAIASANARSKNLVDALKDLPTSHGATIGSEHGMRYDSRYQQTMIDQLRVGAPSPLAPIIRRINGFKDVESINRQTKHYGKRWTDQHISALAKSSDDTVKGIIEATDLPDHIRESYEALSRDQKLALNTATQFIANAKIAYEHAKGKVSDSAYSVALEYMNDTIQNISTLPTTFIKNAVKNGEL